jgi:ribulose 1,5-bisphosphate synthetase/thiazole synthase
VSCLLIVKNRFQPSLHNYPTHSINITSVEDHALKDSIVEQYMNVDMEPKVLIIGCGVAGPVIALLLKKKGYTPVVLEKVRELGDAGASLMMMPNGYVTSPVFNSPNSDLA